MRLAKWLTALVAASLLAGCGGMRFEPLVAHRVWEGPSRAEVFDATIRAIHDQDFLIAAADKEAGIIATDWKNYALEDMKARLRINLLVFEEAEGHVAVSFKSVSQIRVENDWQDLASGDPIDKEDYGRLTRILDDFFLEVQRYVGPSVQRR